MTTRKELKEQFKLLELLEELESLQDSPVTLEVTGYCKKSFSVTGNYTGEPTLSSSLNSIARKHFNGMIKDQIAFVKKNITIPMEDKDK